MRVKKLGALCSVISGGTPSRSKPEYWDGGTIPWIKIGNIKEKFVDTADEYITQAGLNGSSAKMLPKGTILYTIFATLGDTAILSMDACTNQAIAGINILDKSEIITDYLYYFLLSKKEVVHSLGRGVAQNNINLTMLRNFEIPLPPMEQQQQIASVLDKLSTLISLRKQQLAKLDELVKARFVEMFGDPVENPMGWKEKRLDSVAEIVSGITKGRKVKSQELFEVPYMAVSNVKDGYIDWTTVKTISATEEEIAQYRLLSNDVLMTEGGDPDKLGRGAIIHNPPENCIHQNHIFRVRLAQKYILPIYLEQYLQQQKAKRYFLKCAKQTTGIASINATQLRALPILLPPVERQQQYSDFNKQMIESKSVILLSLEKLETLKKALMQDYFR